MKDWQIEERDHWISMVLSVEVGFPKKPTDDKIGLDCACCVELICNSIAVGMLSITKEADGSVADDTRSHPPEDQSLKVLKVVSVHGEDSNVDSQL